MQTRGGKRKAVPDQQGMQQDQRLIGWIRHVQSGLIVGVEGHAASNCRLLLCEDLRNESALWEFDADGCLKHVQSNLFVHPLGGRAGANIQLIVHPGGQERRLHVRLENGFLVHQETQCLVHPLGGVGKLAVPLVYFPGGHGEQRLQFEFISEADSKKDYNPRVEVTITKQGAWERLGYKSTRKLDTLFLDGNQAQSTLLDASEFLQERQWYAARGIPHRRGYLLHGPPGCGKTSFIMALAGELQLPLHIISLSDPSLDANAFTRLLNTAPVSSIILIEDIDVLFLTYDNNKKRPDLTLSASDVLNGLDGVVAPQGHLVFMTTQQRPDQLDRALLRPGRVDVQIELSWATQAQAERLFVHFYSDDQVEAQGIAEMAAIFKQTLPDRKFSMAAIQGYLMRYRRTPADALTNLNHLLD